LDSYLPAELRWGQGIFLGEEVVDLKDISLFFRRRMGALLSLCVVTPLGLFWDAVFLEEIRSTFLGMALIGTCFVWWQFPHYVLGQLD
jgi:hypothetical protein